MTGARLQFLAAIFADVSTASTQSQKNILSLAAGD